MCVVCPFAGVAAFTVCSFLGINPPPTFKGRMVSLALSASAVLITAVALKSLVGISLCTGTGLFTAENIAHVAVKSMLLTILYSIGINALLNRFVYSENCCCNKEKKI